MRTFDWMVVIVAAVVGWLLVNYLFSRGKPKDEEEERADILPAPEPADVPATGLSLEELGRHWHVILGVPSNATAAQIERAYHSKLAEYDAVRFSPDAPDSVKRSAEDHRQRLIQAFEFIRPLR
jgi:hypothetical protein